MIILGIDPGTAITGFGIISVEGNKFIPIDYGCIYTESTLDLEKRLEKIYNHVNLLLDKYKPNEMAVEELFFNKNVKTALSVGQARGAILLAGALKGLKVNSYTPLQIKQGVVGYGRAQKNQVQQMVKVLLNLKEIPKPDDAADAIAVAICHAHFKQTNVRIRTI
ncbi:Holliday junction endonuclease RuvC [Desulfonispora thiosulfatigenes DSM 11270]|uniref:Crossover junction endodeoxyribonuclease RuvC n=1 Tax=Desulfonispora thiosulfatigenes DSM 11270 TaxID=656914 RepID=A0A1W1VQT8_DESTI|nr:crossover junction endodeoxyribonuclease RuvC [Desulfonispora thiosulfatigenes]SMB95735.1 Holliday junction endonuclease RuvC [Desulfonispora thiosulfatigenes DSM 11270]